MLLRCEIINDKLVTDGETHLSIFTLDGEFIEKKNPSNVLKRPHNICLINKDEIIVSDWQKQEFLKLNKNYEFICSYKPLEQKIISCIVYDNQTGFIYSSDNANGKLYCYDDDFKLIKKCDVDHPMYLKILNESLFVRSNLSGNAIIELDKISLHIKNKIEIKNSFSLRGLWTDENNILYTIGKEENQDNSVIYAIEMKGVCISRTPLNCDINVMDIKYFEKKLYLISNEEINIYKFE